jgi:hypothetical protein
LEPSVEEAIQRVKAEIIAPDWRLNVKRIELLDAAFSRLKEQFRSRRSLGAILTMASNVLQYVKNKGDTSPPDSIDFLKEAMANVVNLYEEVDSDPEREEQIFQQVFAHFQELKRKIKALKEPRATGDLIREQPADTSQESHALAPTESRGGGSSRKIELSPEEQAAIVEAAAPHDLGPYEVRQLMVELRESLQRAEEVGAALRELLQTAEAAHPRRTIPAGEGPGRKLSAPSRPSEAEGGRRRRSEHPVESCPPTDLREIVLGEQSLALPADCVALVRSPEASARDAYLRAGQVPLRDFSRVFQFTGTLANIRGRKLKKMVLPIMFLQGFGLPEIPDSKASTLVVLSYGHWHGVLFCSEVQEKSRQMVQFQKAPNGDIAGIGYLEDGGELPVVNLADLLRREGFLALV